MADEEKPEDQQAAANTAEETAGETPMPSAGEPGAETADLEAAAAETVAEDGTAEDSQAAAEAMEAIAENVKNRAAEIEDVLAEVSQPTALPKTAADPETPVVQPEEPAAPIDVLAPTAESTADDEDEPNLQISVGGETLRISTAHPLIEDIAEQLEKSQRFTLYSVGALCTALLAAVLFYVLMAAQLSSKVKEIDAMLAAMAKRTLQMTKGIESFSALETRVDQGLANQLMLQEMLAANEVAMTTLKQQLEAMPGTLQNATDQALGQTQAELQNQLQSVQAETTRLLSELDRAQRSLDEQGAAVGSLRGIRRELTELRGNVSSVEDTVGDLYIIERARVAGQIQDRDPVALGE